MKKEKVENRVVKTEEKGMYIDTMHFVIEDKERALEFRKKLISTFNKGFLSTFLAADTDEKKKKVIEKFMKKNKTTYGMILNENGYVKREFMDFLIFEGTNPTIDLHKMCYRIYALEDDIILECVGNEYFDAAVEEGLELRAIPLGRDAKKVIDWVKGYPSLTINREAA